MNIQQPANNREITGQTQVRVVTQWSLGQPSNILAGGLFSSPVCSCISIYNVYDYACFFLNNVYVYDYISIYIYKYINGDVWFWRLLSLNISFSGWKWCFYPPLENMMGQNTKSERMWYGRCLAASKWLENSFGVTPNARKNHGNIGVLRHVLRWPLYSPDPRAHINVQHDSFVISMIRRDSSYFAVLIVKNICGLKKLG